MGDPLSFYWTHGENGLDVCTVHLSTLMPKPRRYVPGMRQRVHNTGEPLCQNSNAPTVVGERSPECLVGDTDYTKPT